MGRRTRVLRPLLQGLGGLLASARYFVVVDPQAARSFVAGFGDVALAVAFAASEIEAGRELLVLDAASGSVVFPESEVGPNGVPPRASLTRLRRSLEVGDE